MRKINREGIAVPLLLTTALFLLGGLVLSANAEGGGAENVCRDLCCLAEEEESPCANGMIEPPLPEPECGQRRCGCIAIPIFGGGYPPYIIGYDCWCLCEYENVECDDVWWDCEIVVT